MGENYITCREENGSINISEDVITSLVRSAISEVDGVAGLSNTAGAEFAELLGLKTVSRGVKVQFVDGSKIIVDAIITVLYGCNIGRRRTQRAGEADDSCSVHNRYRQRRDKRSRFRRGL